MNKYYLGEVGGQNGQKIDYVILEQSLRLVEFRLEFDGVFVRDCRI